MGLRGELYRSLATLTGKGWRARLQEIESRSPRDFERQTLQRLLHHAVSKVPYYRQLSLADVRLDAFPQLSRSTLQEKFSQLKSDDLANRRSRRVSTGGSTGEPVCVIQDEAFRHWDYATDMHYINTFHHMSPAQYLRSHRLSIWHKRHLSLGYRRLAQLVVRSLGQLIYLEPYSELTAERMTDYLKRINRHRPIMIRAFAGTIFELARFANQRGIRMHRPKFILSSVETLYPPMRELISETFDCPVYNYYGSAEVGYIAGECSHGKMHIFSFANHVEILDADDAPTMPGAVGRIVVTCLHNLAMPLIRYDIGDLARVSSEPCSCGSTLQSFDELRGRELEHFVTPGGGLVFGGNFVAMFYEHDWITGFHVLQVDLDHIRIFYTKAPGSHLPENAISNLNRAVDRIMGYSCHVEWKEVKNVPKSAIGKHLHTRSLVWEAQSGIDARSRIGDEV